MKKLFLVLMVGGLAIGASSCKKDWNCVCDGDVVATIPNAKKADAQDACNVFELGGASCDVEKK